MCACVSMPYGPPGTIGGRRTRVPGLPGRSGRGWSMMLGAHVGGWITLLVRRICALCPAWVVDDG